MLLPRISTNVSVWPAEPDGDPLGALPRFARGVRGAARRHAGAAFARPAVPRHRRCASPQLRAHHAARLAELRRRGRRRAAPMSAAEHRAGAVPPRARPAAALLRHGRGDRASQPSVARRNARAPRSTTGRVRFAPTRSRIDHASAAQRIREPRHATARQARAAPHAAHAQLRSRRARRDRSRPPRRRARS